MRNKLRHNVLFPRDWRVLDVCNVCMLWPSGRQTITLASAERRRQHHHKHATIQLTAWRWCRTSRLTRKYGSNPWKLEGLGLQQSVHFTRQFTKTTDILGTHGHTTHKIAAIIQFVFIALSENATTMYNNNMPVGFDQFPGFASWVCEKVAPVELRFLANNKHIKAYSKIPWLTQMDEWTILNNHPPWRHIHKFCELPSTFGTFTVIS